MRLHPRFVATQGLLYFEGTYAILARMKSIIFQSSPSGICICFYMHLAALQRWHRAALPKRERVRNHI